MDTKYLRMMFAILRTCYQSLIAYQATELQHNAMCQCNVCHATSMLGRAIEDIGKAKDG